MKHLVTLEFLLDEEVTPDLFAQKVALACAGGALRVGEQVRPPGERKGWTIVECDPPLSKPFACDRGTVKQKSPTAKRPKRQPQFSPLEKWEVDAECVIAIDDFFDDSDQFDDPPEPTLAASHHHRAIASGFCDDDGFGVYAKLTSGGVVVKSDFRIDFGRKIPEWATHVVWWNK